MTKSVSVYAQNRMKKNSLPILGVFVIASGLLVTISFPPFDLGFLAWFGLAPFLFALRHKSIPAAAGLGFLFGALLGLGTCYWIYALENVGPPGFILWQLGFALYFLFFGTLYRIISSRIGSWMIIGAPALWVALEYIRANLFFLSCPWTLLGHSQHLYLPVIQFTDITGVYGISFILVMVNQLISELGEEYLIRIKGSPEWITSAAGSINGRYHKIITAFTVFIILIYNLIQLAPQDNAAGSIRVALVQGNVLVDNGMTYEEQVTHLKVYERLTMIAAQQKPDLIVWPATSLPDAIKSNRFVRYTVTDIVKAAGTYLLVGGAGYEKGAPQKKEGLKPYSNTESLLSPAGHRVEQYNKMHLLAFDEYLPLQGIIKWPPWITTLQESFLPGEEYTLFHVKGAKFGTPICSENLYSDHFRRFVKKGAQFMVSVSNEGFLRHTVAPYQTLAMNVFRAVENKVTVARAATTGISAFISPTGKILEKIEDENKKYISIAGIIVRDIPLSDKKTFYTRFGDIFSFITIGLTAIFVIIALTKREYDS